MKFKVISFIIAGALIFGCSKGSGDAPTGGEQQHASHDAHPEGAGDEGHGHDAPISLGAAGTGGDQAHPDTSAIQKIKRSIFVPEEVKGKWRSVKLLVKEKADGGYSEQMEFSLGSKFVIHGSNINVEVKEFMPHLSIGETSFTSLSNEPVNPAVHLLITENGKELYDGWAYAQFPDMYNFRHDKYTVTLVDFTPAG